MELTIAETLTTSAHNYARREALVIGDQRITFGKLNEAVNRRSNTLRELGVGKGDHVGTFSANSLELVETIYALNRIGAVVVPLNIRLSPDELIYMMNCANLSGLVYQNQYEHIVQEIRPSIDVKLFLCSGDSELSGAINFEVEKGKQSSQFSDTVVKENDIATIIYTSGTTGRPKGVVHTHKNWIWAMSNITVSVKSGFEKNLTPFPLFHSGGFLHLYASVFGTNTIFMLPGFDPVLMLKTIEKESINRLGSPPTVYKMLLQSPELAKTDVSSVRYLMSGSEAIPDEIRNQLYKAFPGANIIENYGQTEACACLTSRIGKFTDKRRFSVGRPAPHIRLRIVDENDDDAGPGKVGEIICQTPSTMQGYYQDPEKTAGAIRNGWLYTGDIGELDQDGFLYIKERKNHMIISGGENIYPKEVEDVLYRHPKIIEVAVFGLPDNLWGEKVCAAVVTKPDEQLDAEEVIEFCRNNLASFKKPKIVTFMDILPKNQTGKILRTVLKKEMSDNPGR